MAVTPARAERRGSKPDYQDFSHTGPGTLAGRYLRRFWQPIARSEDLPVGHAKPIRVMSEDFTLYRGEDGTPHVVAFRCAHRGTQLSTGWVEGDCIRCFYHGWKYVPTGQCVEMPAEDPSFPPKVKIASHPTEEYLGLIFGYFGDGAPPSLPRYPFLEDPDPARSVRIVYTDTRPYNFRNRIENSVDPIHVAFVHRNSEYRGLTGCPSVQAEETDYGMILYSLRPGGSMRVTQFQMPTILHIKQHPSYPEETAWRDFLAWRVPIDDESNHIFSVGVVYVSGEAAQRIKEQAEQRVSEDPAPALGEAVLAGKMHVDEVDNLVAAVNVQDYVAQRGQGVIADRESERLGRSDVGVILLRKLYAHELQALDEGRPLKEWQPLVPVATVGL